jgi:hypothetical protein
MLSNRIAVALATLAALLLAAQCRASVSEKKSYEEMSSTSDIVALASVEAIDKNCDPHFRCAKLKFQAVLKGKADKPVRVIFDTWVAEDNPDCCEVGDSYLFYLKHFKGDLYASANGSYGVYRTSPPEKEFFSLDE